MRRISQQNWENEHMHNPMTQGEALAVEDDAIARVFMSLRIPFKIAAGEPITPEDWFDFGRACAALTAAQQPEARCVVSEIVEALIQARGSLRLDAMVDESGQFYPTTTVALEHIDAALEALTAAQQPVQEGGGECTKCRGTGEVCTGYIDGTPEMFDCTCPAAAPPSAPVGVEGYLEWIKAVTRELVALGFSPEAAQLFASAEAAEYERGECDCAENDPKDMVDLFMGTASHIVKKWEKESAGRLYGHKPESLAQQPAQAAPGWKLVPVQSTDAMHRAYTRAKYDGKPQPTLIPDLWAAMLAAAPTPPGDDAAGGGHD